MPRTDDISEDIRHDATYLRELAERILAVPANYGIDQGDTDRLHVIAGKLEKRR